MLTTAGEEVPIPLGAAIGIVVVILVVLVATGVLVIPLVCTSSHHKPCFIVDAVLVHLRLRCQTDQLTVLSSRLQQ